MSTSLIINIKIGTRQNQTTKVETACFKYVLEKKKIFPWDNLKNHIFFIFVSKKKTRKKIKKKIKKKT